MELLLLNITLGLGILILIVMPLCFVAKKCENVFEPLTYCIAIILIKLVLPLIFIRYTNIDDYYFDYINTVLIYILVCVYLIYTGYYLASNKKIRITNIYLIYEGNININYLFILYWAFYVSQIYLFNDGFNHFSENTNSFAFIYGVSSIIYPITDCIFIFLISNLIDKKKYILILFILFSQIYLGINEGGRTKIISPLLFLLFIYSFKISCLSLARYLLLFITAFLFMGPLLTMWKESDPINGKNLEDSYLSRAEFIYNELSPDIYIENVGHVTSQFSGMSEGLIRTFGKVPSEIDYHFGSTIFGPIVWGFVPRILYPEKPIFRLGRYIEFIIWDGKDNFDEPGTSSEISYFGELFLNFSYFGMFFLIVNGVLLYVFFDRGKFYIERTNDSFKILRAYFLWSIVAIFPASEIGGYFSTIIRFVVVYNLLFILMSAKLPKLVIDKS